MHAVANVLYLLNGRTHSESDTCVFGIKGNSWYAQLQFYVVARYTSSVDNPNLICISRFSNVHNFTVQCLRLAIRDSWTYVYARCLFNRTDYLCVCVFAVQYAAALQSCYSLYETEKSKHENPPKNVCEFATHIFYCHRWKWISLHTRITIIIIRIIMQNKQMESDFAFTYTTIYIFN